MTKLLYLQSVQDVTTLLSIESVSVIGLMVFFMIYLIWQNHLLKKEIGAKDEKISEIIKEHQKDLKDGNKDSVAMVNRYHTFIDQLTRLCHGGRHSA